MSEVIGSPLQLEALSNNRIDAKKCPKCKQLKTRDNFSKTRVRYDGLQVYCKQCMTVRQKRYRERNPEKAWASATIFSHRSKGIDVRISLKELGDIAKVSKDCALCGIVLNWKYGQKDKRQMIMKSPSLDRLNNEQFIDKNNFMIICYRCNASKGSLSLTNYISHCENVVNRNLRNKA